MRTARIPTVPNRASSMDGAHDRTTRRHPNFRSRRPQLFWVRRDQSVGIAFAVPCRTGRGGLCEWTPAVNHQGYEGMVHGGIISTVFDEVMAWAISNAGIWAVTGRLNTTFRKPVEIGVPTIARAEIVSIQSRTVDVKATIRRESDDLLRRRRRGFRAGFARAVRPMARAIPTRRGIAAGKHAARRI